MHRIHWPLPLTFRKEQLPHFLTLIACETELSIGPRDQQIGDGFFGSLGTSRQRVETILKLLFI